MRSQTKSWSRSHLADDVLLHEAASHHAQARTPTAELLADLAEIEARRLYADEGYESMRDWCIGELHLSRDAAYRRIRAATAARKFPTLYEAVADGRLHLTAVVLLERYLTPGNLDELIAAATHQDTEAIELMLAHRFPRPAVPTQLRPVASPAACVPLAPAAVTASPPDTQTVNASSQKVALAPLAPFGADIPVPPTLPVTLHTKVAPLAPERFELRGTMDQEMHELLREAQAFLAHAVPSRDAMQVLKHVLRDWVGAAKCRRLAETDKPRRRRSAADGRYIPAEFKRAVRQRDGGRCTFVSDKGRRCSARERLEYDHIVPVARGGRTTPDNLRLRCRAHNQLEAERTFGAGFMRVKREAALSRAARSSAPQSRPAP